MPVATASQTIGPYWGLIDHPEWANLLRFGATGEAVTLIGTVTDGQGELVTDAAIELWQADPPATDIFPAFGRVATGPDGQYRFETLKPGPVPGLGNSQQAPHFALTILARGLMTHLVTRAYFDGDPHNEHDPVLALVDDPARRATLIAKPDAPGIWRMDIRLQGDGETVFLDV